MIKLAIFDMDGLMLDTEPLSIRGWKIAESQLSLIIPDDLYPHLIGLNRDLCKTTMFARIGSFDFETALKILNKSVDDYITENGVPLKPGIIHILDKLDEAGIKKAVATSTATARAMQKLTQAGIAHRFDAIIGGDQVPHSKPAPDIFLKAAKTCDIAPAHCIVLEDSNAGAQGGYSAGMRVIVVPDLDPTSDVTKKQAFAIVNDLFQAWDVISDLNGSHRL